MFAANRHSFTISLPETRYTFGVIFSANWLPINWALSRYDVGHWIEIRSWSIRPFNDGRRYYKRTMPWRT